MTTATEVIQTITANDLAAFTLAYGYGVDRATGKQISWPVARLVAERRNKIGRVTYALCEYRDGSRLTYKYNDATGFKLREVTR